MAAKQHRYIITLFLILILCANLANVQAVRADGETPTEPPAATEASTEPPAQPPVESTPEPVEATPAPQETTAAPVEEILTQVPAATEVVVLDESGETVPLASQEAAEITEIYDPMWCPAGVLPGGSGCQDFPSISALLTGLINSTSTYDHAGIIYFMETTGSQTTGASLELSSSTLGNNDFNTLKDNSLTLRGGWNGGYDAAATFLGTTSFGNNYLQIGTSGNPWIGNVVLENFNFANVTSNNRNAVTVFTTTGNITLTDVNVSGQANGSHTALLDSDSGNIVVGTDNGTSTFDGNGSNSDSFSATTANNRSITISNTSFTDIYQSGGSTNNGAELTAGTVNLTNVTANNFDGSGIVINAPTATLNSVTATNAGNNGIEITGVNTVTLNNVLASNNGTGNNGSGVYVAGNWGSHLYVNGGTFNNNHQYGIEVGNAGRITTHIQIMPTCTGNTTACSNDSFVYQDSTPPVITPNVSGTAGSAGWYRSNVTISWTFNDPESGIRSSTGCNTVTQQNETSGVTLTCSATNNANLSNSASVTIKIDKTAPVLSLPAPITADATSSSGAVVSYSASATDNMGGSITVNCSPASNSMFPLGTTPVNCSASDAAGNPASGAFNVTVRDVGGPVITVPSDMTVEATGSAGAVASFAVTALDNLDGPVAVNCDHNSGDTFPVGTTSITCTATDSSLITSTASFNVTVQDTTAPAIAAHADLLTSTSSGTGVAVIYNSPSTSDLVDGAGLATCLPASGSLFAIGKTEVTCTATDAHKNTATSKFVINVILSNIPVVPVSNPVTNQETATSGASTGTGFTIPLTGGKLINLDCNTVFWAFNVKLSFFNLCDQQTMVDSVALDKLPGKLPAGFQFVMGVDLDILTNGQSVVELPNGTGIQMDFPAKSGTQFAVLYWDGSRWVEVSEKAGSSDVSAIIGSTAGNGLYHLTDGASDNSYPVLTAHKTGIFVLVKK